MCICLHTHIFFFFFRMNPITSFSALYCLYRKINTGKSHILRRTFYLNHIYLNHFLSQLLLGLLLLFKSHSFSLGQNHPEYKVGCLGLHESQSNSCDWWELVLRTQEAEGDVASATQLEMKTCLKFGSFSHPPPHSFYFCGKTWNKATVKMLFIWWVVEVLTQSLQTWHCLNPEMNAPMGFWRNKAACSVAWRGSLWEFQPS